MSCYDRVVHAAVSLDLQRLGLPIEFIIRMFNSIQRMTHRIRTGYGDSSFSYRGDKIPEEYKQMLMGFNQGNGAGPTLWGILSSTISAILREQGYNHMDGRCDG